MPEWYSINELAEKTGIPDSSIRRYIAKLPDFFLSKGGSRSKRYDDKAIKLLIRIKNLYDEGHETEEIDRVLRREFGVVIDSDNVVENEKTSTPTLVTSEDIKEIKDILKQQQEFNKALLERLDKQEQYINNSIEKRDHQVTQLLNHYIETAATNGKQKKISWFKRVLKVKK